MPSRPDLSVVPISTWAVFGAFVVLAVVKLPVLGSLLLWTWTLLMLSDLHTALPGGFYESEAEGQRWVEASIVLSLIGIAGRSLRTVLGWLGLELDGLLGPIGVLAAVVWIVVQFRIVRHVLSALDTLRAGQPRQAGVVATALHLLLMPFFVLSSHYHARHLLAR